MLQPKAVAMSVFNRSWHTCRSPVQTVAVVIVSLTTCSAQVVAIGGGAGFLIVPDSEGYLLAMVTKVHCSLKWLPLRSYNASCHHQFLVPSWNGPACCLFARSPRRVGFDAVGWSALHCASSRCQWTLQSSDMMQLWGAFSQALLGMDKYIPRYRVSIY
ncbi:unnamed protein product [Ostreobium quekettii]|uniref:Uncharacterized protein n=1 Tax=Ostreobium quekettii TaxID=121088 RepID=A0A8S1JAA3_9CHLO|nr:unnamed protein product [Ostreobium quekettii]